MPLEEERKKKAGSIGGWDTGWQDSDSKAPGSPPKTERISVYLTNAMNYYTAMKMSELLLSVIWKTLQRWYWGK